MASRLEAFDIMGSTEQEAEKSRSRFARAAAGGKESTGSERTKMLKEILRQLADLTVLMTSFRARSRQAAAGDHNAKSKS